MKGVFLTVGSTAALDCRTGQNKGRYCKKEFLSLLVLLPEMMSPYFDFNRNFSCQTISMPNSDPPLQLSYRLVVYSISSRKRCSEKELQPISRVFCNISSVVEFLHKSKLI